MDKPIGELSTWELKRRYLSAYQMVEVVECFGTRDVVEMELCARELERRGYEIGAGTPSIRRVAHARR